MLADGGEEPRADMKLAYQQARENYGRLLQELYLQRD
jgi:hypothetical protein